MATQQVDSPLTDVSSSEAPIEQLPVKCGSASGILYLDKFNGRGGQKCILSESVWYSPIEFEGLGGKGKSKNWRKSLLLESSGVLLGTYLSSIGLVTSKSGTASPRQQSPARLASCHFSLPLIDPGLAFIKAYRLKGDVVGLKQAVLARFDSASLGTSHKLLWDTCGEDLEQLGMPFRARRGSDKRQVSDVLIADIVAAFDKLDSVEKIPAVYCEATDLIKLPSLTLDPVSKKLDENTTALQSLAHKVEELPSEVSTAATNPVTKCYSEMEKLISDIKVQLQQFFGCVNTLSLKISGHHPSSSTITNVRHSTGGGQSSSIASSGILLKQPASGRDRSNNVILFGLPELSLLEAKTAIDNVFTYLIGKNVKVVDAFRLGRRSEAGSARPRPMLIKLDNCWDRRLLLSSCRKLKDYSVSKLFLREDLPPEARISRPKGQANKVSQEAHANVDNTSTVLPIQPSTVTATLPGTELYATDMSVAQPSTVTAIQSVTELDVTDKSVPRPSSVAATQLAIELDATNKLVPQPSTVITTHSATEFNVTDKSVPPT